MRVWLAAAANRSAAGDWIWRERVVGRTFRRSRALQASFAQSVVPVLARRNGILSPACAITIPEERADRYFVRIVKGLLTHFYPGLDYATHAFSVEHLMPQRDDIAMLLTRFTYDERGGGSIPVFSRNRTPTSHGFLGSLFL